MDIVFLDRETPPQSPCAATIGFFDGVHRGHRFLIQQVVDTAQDNGLTATVITFDRHPRQVVRTDYQPQMLSTLNEKLRLLATTGAERCVVLPFNEDMAALSAHDFMQGVLHERLNVRALVIGYDNRFGHNRSEGFDDYVRYGQRMRMSVTKALPLVIDGINVSSSVVRNLLKDGDVEMAAKCLGYDYSVSGTVCHGEHIGTTIGYPTANIEPSAAEKLIPADGVYAVEAHIGADRSRSYAAMLNIGERPTFGGKGRTIEAHLLDFSDDLYGSSVTVSFVARLRQERKFSTPESLALQLQRDATETRYILEAHKRQS